MPLDQPSFVYVLTGLLFLGMLYFSYKKYR